MVEFGERDLELMAEKGNVRAQEMLAKIRKERAQQALTKSDESVVPFARTSELANPVSDEKIRLITPE